MSMREGSSTYQACDEKRASLEPKIFPWCIVIRFVLPRSGEVCLDIVKLEYINEEPPFAMHARILIVSSSRY